MRTSDTALEQYDRCPLQFKVERIDKKRGVFAAAARLGNVLHDTLKTLLKWHKTNADTDVFDAKMAAEVFNDVFVRETGLTGQDHYNDGLQMVADWVGRFSPLDPKTIVGVELPFFFTIPSDEIEGGVLEVVGRIDLILMYETTDEDTGEVYVTIEVIDWKTSRGFFTTRDAAESLQLAIYDIAARKLFPDATRYRASLHMLRDGTHIQIQHTSEQLEDTKQYIVALARKIQNDTQWRPKLNANCVYCSHRHNCQAYKNALAGDEHIVCEDMDDLDTLVKERDALAIRQRIMKKRIEEIDAIIKPMLKVMGSLEIGDFFFKMSQTEKKRFPPEMVVGLLVNKLGVEPQKVISELLDVNNKKLNEFLNAAAKQIGQGNIAMIRAALENKAIRTYSSRLYHRKAKGTKKKK